MTTQTRLILASASPRRKQLLEQIGYSFEVVPSHVDEPAYKGHQPVNYAEDLANLKSKEISDRYPDALVLGADTIVVIDEEVLGKPVDPSDAFSMLEKLSGRNHVVITAYSLQLKRAGIENVHSVSTQVHFKQLEKAEINQYIQSGAPFDKAGAYGIQDYSSIFVDQIEGCFYNVVGFPLSDFNEKMKQLMQRHSIVLT